LPPKRRRAERGTTAPRVPRPARLGEAGREAGDWPHKSPDMRIRASSHAENP
jgi:hypothetical protein